jgi:hypothetical protein
MKIIQTILFDDRKRRVVVFQRDDGSFGFDEQHYAEDPLESPWLPTGDFAAARFDSAARALIEARKHVPWLAEARIDGAD